MSDVKHLAQQIRNIASAYPKGLGTQSQQDLIHSADTLEATIEQLQVEVERLRGILDKVFPRYTASDWALLDEAENLIAEFDAAKTPPQEQSNE